MSQKTDNLIKLALVFFVSLLSFSIGTYVGKKYSDNQHKLALLEPKKDKEDTLSEKSVEEFATEHAKPAEKADVPNTHTAELTGSTETKPAALTDSEVAKIAEEFASEEENTEEKIVAKVENTAKPVAKISATPKPVEKITLAKTVETPTEKQPINNTNVTPTEKKTLTPAQAQLLAKAKETQAEKNEVAESTVVKPTPSDNVETVREPASLPPKQEIVPIHYTVQIGSFPTQTEAEQLTKSLQNKGYKTSFVPAKVNGQIWYRVNVGLFGTIREAQEYKKEFLEQTKLSSAIVQRVQH